MRHYIYFSFLLICMTIHAQTNDTTRISKVDSIFSPKLTGEAFFDDKHYVGCQYYNEDWSKGNILLSTGSLVYCEKMKYNGLFDEVIWTNTSNYGKFKVDKSFISEFWIKNALDSTIHFKKINISDPESVHRSCVFAEVGVEGKLSLYIQRKISVLSIENEYVNNKLYYFENIGDTPLYYLKLASNRYVMLRKIRRRPFLKLFPEQKKTISKVLKENHLNFKSESDFVKVIDLLNRKVF